MTVRSDEKTTGHIPEDLSKIMYFFLKKVGRFKLKITGPRQHSRNLIQRGLKLSCTYTYSTTHEELYGKLVELISDFMESYHIRIQKLVAKTQIKRRKTLRKNRVQKYNTIYDSYFVIYTVQS